MKADPTVNRQAKMFIPVARPDISDAEVNAANDCVKSGWISQGERVERFEQLIARSHWRRYGVACNSGTTALHLALVASHATRVTMPTHTMVAVGNAARYVNAEIAYCGGRDMVGSIDFGDVPQSHPIKNDAIIVPHTYGVVSEPNDYVKANFTVIEDCAEAHYAHSNGAPVGSFGDMAVFSFYANKIVTTGEGGMVITNDESVAAELRSLRSHAFNPQRHFDHNCLAFGYRMTDVQAAIGIVQHERREEMLERRRRIAVTYTEALLVKEAKIAPAIFIPDVPMSSWWVYPVVCDSEDTRDSFRQHLADAGIETRTYFKPLHTMLHLKGISPLSTNDSLEKAQYLASRGLYLPVFSNMTDSELNYVIEHVKSFSL